QTMRKRFVSYGLILDFATIALIIMWSYAAFSKLLGYEEFRFGLLNHDLLKNHAGIVARVIPVAELIIVLLLLIPRLRKVGFISSFIMLLVFTIYIVYMFMFYPHKPCSCGGIMSSLSWVQHIVFNIVFALLSTI